MLFIAATCFAQDLTIFEVMDNENVGLTVAPFGKGGLALADIDRNGYPDIFCLRWSEPGYSRIYINDGSVFQDITDGSPLEQIESAEAGTRTTMWVDFDNDGDKDLSMATTDGIHLLRNDDNIFTEVSEEMGFVAPKPGGFIIEWDSNICGWADYDLDGDLDCVTSQLSNPNLYLFRNDGDTFTNAAADAGLEGIPLADEWRVVFTDFDLDGDADLVGRNSFFRNDSGVFTNVSEELGLADVGPCWYRRFFDYDNDGDLDFFKASRSTEADEFDELWENQDGVFIDVSNEVGFLSQRFKHRGMTFGDFDNDGDQDIFMDGGIVEGYDNLFVNEETAPGEHSFADVAEFTGITVTGDRKGCGFFDYNRDGFLDIYMPSAEINHILYRNSADNRANWAGFILEGTESNRDGVGCIITLHTGDKKQLRLTRCGDIHFHQYNPWVNFGIGYETSIDSVVIRWPSGIVQVLDNVAINQYHDITESAETVVERDNKNGLPVEFQLEQNSPNPFNPSTRIDYKVPHQSQVKISIYNLMGELVAVLLNESQIAGSYSVTWNGNDQMGQKLPSGLYIYNLQTGDFELSRKMMFIQ
jgi:hypothetical protein